MNKTELLRIHQQQKRNNDRHSSDLLNILGGIDNVLTMILSSNDTNVNENQISEIHKVITCTINKDIKTTTRINIKKDINQCEDDLNDKSNWTLYFNIHDTYLNSMFEDTTALKIMNIIYSKYIIISITILCLLLIISRLVLNHLIVFRIICAYFAFIIFILYMILMSLSANTRTYSMIKYRFEFWLKLYYMMQYNIFYCFVYRIMIDPYNISTIAWVPLAILHSFVNILCVIYFSFFDGLHMKLWAKAFLSSLFAIYFSFVSIYYGYYTYINGKNGNDAKDPSLMYIKFLGIHISVVSLIGNSAQILVVFSLKQLYLTLFKRGKCVLIRFPSPYLKWIGDTNTNTNTNTHVTAEQKEGYGDGNMDMEMDGDNNINKQQIELSPLSHGVDDNNDNNDDNKSDDDSNDDGKVSNDDRKQLQSLLLIQSPDNKEDENQHSQTFDIESILENVQFDKNSDIIYSDINLTQILDNPN